MNEKILITGGAGFIGSNVARKLLKDGYKVTILDNFHEQIHGSNKTLPDDLTEKVRLIRGSVTNKELFYETLKEQNTVIHYAAETGTGQSMYDVYGYTDINILATATLCDFIINEEHQIQNVIVASSRSIYGEGKYQSPDHGFVYPESRTIDSVRRSYDPVCPISGNVNLTVVPTDEQSKIHPSSFYGITKQVQEQMVIMAAKLKKINGFALRYQNVYGPGQSLKNPYTGILSIFSRLALKNETINIFEDGKESRDFVFIDVVVEATVSCINQKITGQFFFNVGSGKNTTVLEVAEFIKSFFKSKSKIIVSGAFREGDIRHNVADISLIKNTTGFTPKWAFKDGLNSFLEWVNQQQDIPLNVDDYKRSLEELKQRGLLNG
jgi:dTDP-L-rhamnose 4-epimerase